MFKILVVEDDRELNRSVCSFLNNSGYEATGCQSANEAYDAMYDTIFDLIISDIMMPGIDGYEFAKTVRSLNEDIPILFMTARDDIASKQRGYRVGIDDYMIKPIDFAAALVSMLSLETAMFSQFGQETSPEMHRIMILTTGICIAIIVVMMAMYIIVRNTKEIKQIKKKQKI